MVIFLRWAPQQNYNKLNAIARSLNHSKKKRPHFKTQIKPSIYVLPIYGRNGNIYKRACKANEYTDRRVEKLYAIMPKSLWMNAVWLHLYANWTKMFENKRSDFSWPHRLMYTQGNCCYIAWAWVATVPLCNIITNINFMIWRQGQIQRNAANPKKNRLCQINWFANLFQIGYLL